MILSYPLSFPSSMVLFSGVPSDFSSSYVSGHCGSMPHGPWCMRFSRLQPQGLILFCPGTDNHGKFVPAVFCQGYSLCGEPAFGEVPFRNSVTQAANQTSGAMGKGFILHQEGGHILFGCHRTGETLFPLFFGYHQWVPGTQWSWDHFQSQWTQHIPPSFQVQHGDPHFHSCTGPPGDGVAESKGCLCARVNLSIPWAVSSVCHQEYSGKNHCLTTEGLPIWSCHCSQAISNSWIL